MVDLLFYDSAAATRAASHMDIESDFSLLITAVPEGTPIYLEGHTPAEFWFDFGVYIGLNWRDPTRRQYAYTALGFANFIGSRGTPVAEVVEPDLIEYRQKRVDEDLLSPSSWSTEATVIRLIFDYAIERELIKRRPWIDVGRRNAVSQPNRTQAEARALTPEEWRAFRDVGLLGRDEHGRPDTSFMGKHSLRNAAGAQVALATGLRVCEFHSLLTTEVEGAPDQWGGVHVAMEECAKGRRPRTIYLPGLARRAVLEYIATERAALISRRPKRVLARTDDLFVVDPKQSSATHFTGTLYGRRITRRVADLGPALRRRTYLRTEHGLEPAALFVNAFGRMTSKSTWHRVFNAASARVAGVGSLPSAAADVQPHVLRHSFARMMLAFLSEMRSDNPDEYGGIDPLVEVQRMLGHASLTTTSIYLESDRMGGEVEEAFAAWTETADYGSLIASWLPGRWLK